MISNTQFRLAITPLILFVFIFPLLAIDVMAQLLRQAEFMERGNLTLLLFFEGTQAIRTLIGVTLAIVLIVKLPGEPYARALALFLLFETIAYGAILSGGYAGPGQVWLSGALQRIGLARAQIQTAFGYPAWAAWLACAGLIRFALLFPEPVSADAIAGSGSTDRAGMMSKVPGAGADVGGIARWAVAYMLRKGWLENAPLWTACFAGAVLSINLRSSPLRYGLWLLLLLGVGIAITAFRARYVTGLPATRERIGRLTREWLIAAGLFVAAGLVSMTIPGVVADVTNSILLTLAPLFLLLGIALGVFQRSSSRVNEAPVGT